MFDIKDKKCLTFEHIVVIIYIVRCAAMAQVVEHILGKDEVTSSNLVSSSRKRKTRESVSFLFQLSVPYGT